MARPEWLARVFLGGDRDEDARARLFALRDGRMRVTPGPLDRFREVFGPMELDVADLLGRYADARLPVRAIRNTTSRDIVPDRADLPPFDCTFSFTAAGRVVPFIAAMDAALSEWLGVTVECNVYCSHDGSVFTGLAYHFDEFPVMVLQVQGSKHWSLGSALPRYPEQGMPIETLAHPYPAWFAAAFRPGEVQVSTEHEVTLVPGTVLAFPAGMWHSTRAEGLSISMTFGARAPVWTSVLRQVLRGVALAQTPELFAPACALFSGNAATVPWSSFTRLRDAFAALRGDARGLAEALRSVVGTGALRWCGAIRRDGDRHRVDPEAEGAADVPVVRDAVLDVDAPGMRALANDHAWHASPMLRAFAAGEDVPTEIVPMRAAVARVLGPGRGRIEVAPELGNVEPALARLAGTATRVLSAWTDDVTVRGWRMREAATSAWFVRGRDSIAIGVAGTAEIELAGPHVVADDEEHGAGVQFTRRAAMPSAPHAPLVASRREALAPGTMCVVPRGTWMRVNPHVPIVAWNTLELHHPSWLGLLEVSMLEAAAQSSALSRVAFEAIGGAWSSTPVEDSPALAQWQRALDRIVDAPERAWALWCDGADYLPGQLVAPSYELADDAAARASIPADVHAWMIERRGPFALAGFAKRFTPTLVPGAALAALEHLVDRGALRRVAPWA